MEKQNNDLQQYEAQVSSFKEQNEILEEKNKYLDLEKSENEEKITALNNYKEKASKLELDLLE